MFPSTYTSFGSRVVAESVKRKPKHVSTGTTKTPKHTRDSRSDSDSLSSPASASESRSTRQHLLKYKGPITSYRQSQEMVRKVASAMSDTASGQRELMTELRGQVDEIGRHYNTDEILEAEGKLNVLLRLIKEGEDIEDKSGVGFLYLQVKILIREYSEL